MQIIFKDKNLVAVNKSAGIPSQKDPTGDADAMTLAGQILRTEGERDALWLVHRLDRVVGGVLVFARNKSAAAELSERVADKTAVKEYLAVVEGIAGGGVLEDLLYKDARQGKAFVVDSKREGVKEARLEYTPICNTETEKGVRTLVRIRLLTGRFHQIRAQFSSRGHSISGDGKYGSHDNRAKTPALFACRMAFECSGKHYDITAMPDVSAYPWNLFPESAYTKEQSND